MSILESLKEEKKLSLNHWRYRLLHWCFNVKDVNKTTPFSGDLPRCLYTHYCPLFHLTNLIAIFSPIILLVKIVVAMAGAFIYALSQIKFSWPTKEPVVEPEPTAEEYRRREYKNILEWLKHPGWWDDFSKFWDCKKDSLKFLTQEEVKARYDELVPKYQEAYARAEARRKKLRDRLIFWTNFSRVFIKWVMNVAYISLVGVLLYGLYWIAEPTYGLIKWFLTFDPIPFMLFMGKIFLSVGLVFTIFYFLFKIKAFQTAVETAAKAGAYAAPPALLMWHVMCAPCRWVAQGWCKMTEFISVFYEENCPPVAIISEEEEKIEEVANNG